MFLKFEDFQENLNESRVTFKRKYTENHPAKNINSGVVTRNKILSYIDENQQVSLKQMKKYLETLSEDLENKPSENWLFNHKDLIDKFTNNEGKSFYMLTKKGKKIVEKIKQFNIKTKQISESEDISED